MVGGEYSLGSTNGTVNQNVAPTVSLFFTPIAPSSSSIRFFEMLNPSPVPPYFLVVVSSAWRKGSKRFASWPIGTPIPLSITSIFKNFCCEELSLPVSSVLDVASIDSLTVIEPCSVNLTALLNKLMSTCLRRVGSEMISVGVFSSMSILIFKCFLFAAGVIINMHSRIRSVILN